MRVTFSNSGPVLGIDTLASKSGKCLVSISNFALALLWDEGRGFSVAETENATRYSTKLCRQPSVTPLPLMCASSRFLCGFFPQRCLRGCADQTSGVRSSYERKPEVRKSKMDGPASFHPKSLRPFSLSLLTSWAWRSL